MTTPERIAYGSHASQHVEVWRPAGPAVGVALLLHGGYWRDRWDLHLMDAMAAALVADGWLAVNAEYRRVGSDGGGDPATFDDVAGALALAATLVPAGGPAPVVIGHSAGGHLALLCPGFGAVAAVVALAPVSDLHECDRRHLSDDAVRGLLDGSADEQPERYAARSPVRHLPLGVPTLVVHGDADVNVPLDLSLAYADAARVAGDDVTLEVLPGVGHMELIDPAHPSWSVVPPWVCAFEGS